MKDPNPILLLVPLAVGCAAVVCTIFIHALPLSGTIRFIRREKKLGHLGVNFQKDMGVVMRTMLYAFLAHLIEMALWAALYVICGEFSDLPTAFYHSAVNYTSLGYGDIIMSPAWRLLGPLETADGMLLFGVSTGMIFAVIQRLIQERYAEFKE
jgi:hypothetical protein